jgi:hypothetical protein
MEWLMMIASTWRWYEEVWYYHNQTNTFLSASSILAGNQDAESDNIRSVCCTILNQSWVPAPRQWPRHDSSTSFCGINGSVMIVSECLQHLCNIRCPRYWWSWRWKVVLCQDRVLHPTRKKEKRREQSKQTIKTKFVTPIRLYVLKA